MLGKKVLVVLFWLVVSINALADYNIVDRFRLYDDRLKTVEMLRPYGHDFLLNINAALNPDVKKTLDDAEKISKSTGSAQLTDATTFLNNHKNEEFIGKFDLAFGIPLPSFTVSGIKFIPDLRFGTNLAAQVGTKAVPLTAQTVVDLLGPEIPQSIVDLVVTRFDTTADGQPLLTDSDCVLILGAANTAENCTKLKDKYLKPANPDIADLFAYVKYESQFGPIFNAYKGDFFGSFNPYVRHRADLKRRFTAEFLAEEGEFFEKEELVDFVDLVSDFMFGYKKGEWKIYAAIEELKIAELKKNMVLDGTRYGKTFYGNEILFRLHSDYTFKLAGFALTPFGGIHKRSGYDLVDGLYAGADLGFSFWQDRFGLLAKAMLDNEYITLAPRLQLWVMQLEIMGKIAHKSEVDGTKIANIYSLNFRLFF